MKRKKTLCYIFIIASPLTLANTMDDEIIENMELLFEMDALQYTYGNLDDNNPDGVDELPEVINDEKNSALTPNKRGWLPYGDMSKDNQGESK
ncbi:MAG: hypothetical protein R3A80_01985 [Bdellovibrionota bacterium]